MIARCAWQQLLLPNIDLESCHDHPGTPVPWVSEPKVNVTECPLMDTDQGSRVALLPIVTNDRFTFTLNSLLETGSLSRTTLLFKSIIQCLIPVH
jgi:hypothetical protein